MTNSEESVATNPCGDTAATALRPSREGAWRARSPNAGYMNSVPFGAPATHRREATPPAIASEGLGARGKLILIVDDDAQAREATAAQLARHGYRTLTAEDGADALALYVRHGQEIQAVLTDVTMPVVDGVALCRALRKLDPKVILLATIDSNDAVRRREIQLLELAGLLSKPFDAQTLLETVDRAIKTGGAPK